MASTYVSPIYIRSINRNSKPIAFLTMPMRLISAIVRDMVDNVQVLITSYDGDRIKAQLIHRTITRQDRL